jgi:hypothetical protein
MVADMLTYIVADMLADNLAYMLTYIVADMLADHLAYNLAYMLADHLAYMLADHLADHLAYILADILALVLSSQIEKMATAPHLYLLHLNLLHLNLLHHNKLQEVLQKYLQELLPSYLQDCRLQDHPSNLHSKVQGHLQAMHPERGSLQASLLPGRLQDHPLHLQGKRGVGSNLPGLKVTLMPAELMRGLWKR